MDWKIVRGQEISIFCSEKETEAVRIAVKNLAADLKKVLGVCAEIAWPGAGAGGRIVVASADRLEDSRRSGALTGEAENTEAAGIMAVLKALSGRLPQKDGAAHAEAYIRSVQDGVLYILGADRRGTIYGIYDLCQWMGVSPWYYWADVPVKEKDMLMIPEGDEVTDYPSVEYRGVFINDEEELEKWVRLHMGEDTIGVKTYEKIFELLLRLKGNYIWPAMHVNSFNIKKENGALADRMGMVVGTSHCDMLMRSNNREWYPWLTSKGYTDVEYDYSIPGKNREILDEYWRESVEQNQDFEVSYTLGMRGIHDSGFETKSLQGLSGKELLDAKIALLDQVITAQRGLLKEVLGEEKESRTMKNFVPYKEVLELYNNGLEVPEEFTLIWANDNYGHIRRFPNEQEKKRKGGNGIYYHNSYWAPPGGSYLFIDSIPLTHTRNELQKAWNEGIRKLWVMNIGALKPLEEEIEFYLRLAWEIGKPGSLTEDTDRYLADWINRTFSGSHGAEMADILNSFAQLTNVRKIEQLDTDTFSQTAYGDEASERINQYHQLFERANAVYDALPEAEKDAFFELCLMKIHAAYLTNCMYYYADRSALCVRQGKAQAAAEYVRRCREYDDARRQLLVYYGTQLAEGKWEGIVTPEDFPPPRTAMYPACVPPLSIGEPKLLADCWNEEEGIHFVKEAVKWFQLSNAGTGSLDFTIEAPDWLILSEKQGSVSGEKRILVSVKPGIFEEEAFRSREGEINIFCRETEQELRIPVSVDLSRQDQAGLEDGGICVLGAQEAGELRILVRKLEEKESAVSGAYTEQGLGWKLIPGLGRHSGALAEAVEKDSSLTYTFTVREGCEPTLELHRFPSLNATGRIRILVSVDGGEKQLLESASTDEWKGTWKTNIRNNVDKISLKLPTLTAGEHTLVLTSVDPYFAFSKLVIYTKERKESMLGGIKGGALPGYVPAGEELFYGNIPLRPRDMLCGPVNPSRDTLVDQDVRIPQECYGGQLSVSDILNKGRSRFEEKEGHICIDAAAALSRSEYAYTGGREWDYCSSESYGRSGLAMHIRKSGLVFREQIPALNYRFYCKEGSYRLWMLMKCNTREDSWMKAVIDGRTGEFFREKGGEIPGESVWRYSAEQVYRWVPVDSFALEEGEHLLTIESYVSALRFDRIYLTRGEELPPTDSQWEA